MGSVLAFTGALVILVMNALLPIVRSEALALGLGVLVGVVVGACAGAFNGLMITRGRIAPFIVTLGTMAIFRSLMLYIGDAGEIQSRNALYGAFGMGSVLGVPIPVIVFLGIALVLHIVLNSTQYGRYLCVVGSNQRVALFSAMEFQFLWVQIFYLQ